jgi:hypothetical protein
MPDPGDKSQRNGSITGGWKPSQCDRKQQNEQETNPKRWQRNPQYRKKGAEMIDSGVVPDSREYA